MLTTVTLAFFGAVAVLVGLYLIAPPLALVVLGAALIRYAVVRETTPKETA